MKMGNVGGACGLASALGAASVQLGKIAVR